MISKKRIQVIDEPGAFSIRFPWLSFRSGAGAGFMFFFGLFWNGFLVVWIFAAIASGSFEMILFSILHVAVGIYLLYYSLTTFINSTTILIDREKLYVKKGPLPWRGDHKEFNVKEIEQFYVKRQKVGSTNGNPIFKFVVHLVQSNGIHKDLIKAGSLSLEEAQQVEEQLENYLQITDYRVEGEWQANLKIEFSPHTQIDKTDWGFDPSQEQTKPEVQPLIQPRRLQKTSNRKQIDTIIEGDFVSYKLSEYVVKKRVQSDWKNGETDFHISLQSEISDPLLVYLRIEHGITNIYIENKLNPQQLNTIPQLQNPAPEIIAFEGVDYSLVEFLDGYKFVFAHNRPIAVLQWRYTAQMGDKQLRIEFLDGYYQAFQGQYEVKASFSQFLSP